MNKNGMDWNIEFCFTYLGMIEKGLYAKSHYYRYINFDVWIYYAAHTHSVFYGSFFWLGYCKLALISFKTKWSLAHKTCWM